MMINKATNRFSHFAKAKMLMLLLMPLIIHCQSWPTDSLPYDLENPRVIQLSKELKEISGIVIKDRSLFAITDNTGQLFELDTANGKIIAKWQFGKIADYEDIAVAKGSFYILNSNGNIIRFSMPDEGKPKIKEFNFPFGKSNEFEILYYDEITNKLVMVCKECKGDKNKKLSVYTINPETGKYSSGDFIMNPGDAEKNENSKKERLKPSAAAVHPQTGEIYMISSINKMLIRINRNGKVVSVITLKRSLFEQPEGLAFTVAGDLLISNEAGKKKHATILLFKNKINP